ncbi:MAG: GyrI-like domain-containing protein [Candidatus Acidiferrales bacterium]
MKTSGTVDLYRKYFKEYVASRNPALVKVGPAMYLSISGNGAPGSTAFTEAIGALYGVAFTVKMARKFAGKRDYVVSKLEGLWPNFSSSDKNQWSWQLLIRTPKFVTQKEVTNAVGVLLKRGKSADVRRVGLESLEEGLCVQVLHVGPYDNESPTIAGMKSYAEGEGLKLRGVHHEIYLSDPRRVSPAKLKTILRHPVERVVA